MKEKIKDFVINVSISKVLVLSGLLAVVWIAPMFIHSQWVTGPLVNAILILACVMVGPMEAVALGIVPSTVALSSGLLPLPLAPIVPFIIMSNAIFVLGFHYLRKQNFLLGVIAGAGLKFLFLYLTVTYFVQNLLQQELLQRIAVMMSWPQFVTAVLGGVIALGILKISRKNEK